MFSEATVPQRTWNVEVLGPHPPDFPGTPPETIGNEDCAVAEKTGSFRY
jgi:hypothetical protein